MPVCNVLVSWRFQWGSARNTHWLCSLVFNFSLTKKLSDVFREQTGEKQWLYLAESSGWKVSKVQSLKLLEIVGNNGSVLLS